MQQISLASRLTYLLAQRFLQDSEHDKYSASLFYVSPLYPEVKPPLTTNPPSPLGLPQSGQDDLLGQLWSAVEGRPRPPLEAVWGDGGEGAVVWGWSRHVPSLQKLPTTELHKVNCISGILYHLIIHHWHLKETSWDFSWLTRTTARSQYWSDLRCVQI